MIPASAAELSQRLSVLEEQVQSYRIAGTGNKNKKRRRPNHSRLAGVGAGRLGRLHRRYRIAI